MGAVAVRVLLAPPTDPSRSLDARARAPAALPRRRPARTISAQRALHLHGCAWRVRPRRRQHERGTAPGVEGARDAAARRRRRSERFTDALQPALRGE